MMKLVTYCSNKWYLWCDSREFTIATWFCMMTFYEFRYEKREEKKGKWSNFDRWNTKKLTKNMFQVGSIVCPNKFPIKYVIQIFQIIHCVLNIFHMSLLGYKSNKVRNVKCLWMNSYQIFVLSANDKAILIGKTKHLKTNCVFVNLWSHFTVSVKGKRTWIINKYLQNDDFYEKLAKMV